MQTPFFSICLIPTIFFTYFLQKCCARVVLFGNLPEIQFCRERGICDAPRIASRTGLLELAFLVVMLTACGCPLLQKQFHFNLFNTFILIFKYPLT